MNVRQGVENNDIVVGGRCQLVHVTPGKYHQTIADVPCTKGNVLRIWRKKHADEDCAKLRFDDGTEWSGVSLSHIVPLDAADQPVWPTVGPEPPVLGGSRARVAVALKAGDRVELIRVAPCALVPSLESVACRIGGVVRIYKRRGDDEPVAHVLFDDGTEWLGLSFEDLLRLGEEPPVGPAPDNAPTMRG